MKSVMVSKTVKYRCGCEVTLNILGQSECGVVCDAHFEPIQRVTTVEEFQ